MNLENIERQHNELEVAAKEKLDAYHVGDLQPCYLVAPQVASLRERQVDLETSAAEAPVECDQDALSLAKIANRLCTRCDAAERDKSVLIRMLGSICNHLVQKISSSSKT